jgi:SH3 domain-containing YSC84-like protein 1
VMTQRGMNSLLSASVRGGVDASVAAGPVGIGAGRAPRPTADFIYYSRSKGLYGGATLEGAMIRPADGWNRAYYGRTVSPREILVSGSVRSPRSNALLETLDDTLRVVARRR